MSRRQPKAKGAPENGTLYNAECRACPRLAENLAQLRRVHPSYHNAPVAAFGDDHPAFLVVGLAPGKHGANRTGRPFTGDYAGKLLYETLHQYGFASHVGSDDPFDGLRLISCRITNAVKCLPPENKPLPAEILRCNVFLKREIAHYAPRIILALGRVAHEAILRSLSLKLGDYPFAHAAVHELPVDQVKLTMLDSYHCSRYNTQTRRLTPVMFQNVIAKARELLEAHDE